MAGKGEARQVVVVGIDGFTESIAALGWASRYAAATGAKVRGARLALPGGVRRSSGGKGAAVGHCGGRAPPARRTGQRCGTGGAGSRLWDVDGNAYLDYHNGFGVTICGHGHPKIVDAIGRAASLAAAK